MKNSTGRREQQREAMYADIVATSRAMLASGEELSLRAIAGRMGLTAPALYRYVANYQELVDLVAFEIDKAATVGLAEAADTQPSDDPAARLVCAATAFRQWALASPREFSLVFANPTADAACVRREMLTAASSGHFFTDLLVQLWQKERFPLPQLEDLDPAVAEVLRDPLIPAKVEDLPDEVRGLIWVFMSAWTRLYGVVALEVFGHMDPRVIESGAMFLATIGEVAPQLGMGDDWPRLEKLVRARLSGVGAKQVQAT